MALPVLVFWTLNLSNTEVTDLCDFFRCNQPVLCALLSAAGLREFLLLIVLFSPLQTSESEVHFDVEIAIKVLRQAGYYSHAVFLAEKHTHHEWYLKIQLEDLKVSHCHGGHTPDRRRGAMTQHCLIGLFSQSSTV